MRVQQNRLSKAQKDRAKEKIYLKRHEYKQLRELVKSLTEEEKQSEAYCGIVALVNERLEKKRLENIKYRYSKLAYAKRKRESLLNQQQQVVCVEDNKLFDAQLDNCHFDIFDSFSIFDSL